MYFFYNRHVFFIYFIFYSPIYQYVTKTTRRTINLNMLCFQMADTDTYLPLNVLYRISGCIIVLLIYPQTTNLILMDIYWINLHICIYLSFSNFFISPYLADPGEARGCSTNTSVVHSFIQSVCENIFTAPPPPNGLRWGFQS